MDKKFKIKYNNKINITLLLITAICLVGIVCDTVFMALAISSEKSFIGYIVSLAMLVILLIILAVFLFGSFYAIEKNHFVICMCFFKKKIDYNDILNIRHNKDTKQTIAYYYTYSKTGEQLVSLMYINVKETELETLVKELKDKNNLLIYDIFGEDNNNAKD